MTKLKNILQKFNLNPELTEALFELDFVDIYDNYQNETVDGNKFLVLRGTTTTPEGEIYPQELVIDEQNQKVVAYGYPFNDTKYEKAPIFYQEYDKNGEIIGI